MTADDLTRLRAEIWDEAAAFAFPRGTDAYAYMLSRNPYREPQSEDAE